MRLVAIPFANHTFGVPASSGPSAVTTLSTIAGEVADWTDALLLGMPPQE
jgi:hypothetical protein